LKDADGVQLVNGIFAAVPYCIDLIKGPYMETDPAILQGLPSQIGAASGTTPT